MKEKISESPESCIFPNNRKVLNLFRQETWSPLLNGHLLIFRLPATCCKLLRSLTTPHPTFLSPGGRLKSCLPGSKSSGFPPKKPNSQLLGGGIFSVDRQQEVGTQPCVVKRRKGLGEVRKKQVPFVRTTLNRSWGSRGSTETRPWKGSRSYKMHAARFRSKEMW